MRENLVGDETIKWYACADCAELIDTDNWELLIEHSLHAYTDMRWIPKAEEAVVQKQVQNLVLAFRAFRPVPA